MLDRYRSMSDADIVDLWITRRTHLTDGARQSLDQVIAERGINVQSEVDHEIAECDAAQRAELDRAARANRRDRILMWAGAPLGAAAIFLAPLLRPQSAAESFVAATVEAFGTVAICYALLLVFRRRK